MWYAIVPSNASLNIVLNEIKVDVFTRAPIGYVTRFLTIATNTSTSTLPAISYNFATTSALYDLGLTDISFDPFSELNSSANILNSVYSDQDEPQNVWDIMELPVQLVVYMSLFFLILKDLLNLQHSHSGHKNKLK